MKKIIDKAFQKYNGLSDDIINRAWTTFEGPATDALEDACEKLAGVTGLEKLEALGVIVGTLLERDTLGYNQSLEELAEPFMRAIFGAHFRWSQISTIPRDLGISDAIGLMCDSLKIGDMPRILRASEELRHRLFGLGTVDEAQIIYDETIKMERELFEPKRTHLQFEKVLLQAYIDFYEHPKDVKYEKIKDEVVKLAKTHYGIRDARIRVIRQEALWESACSSSK